MASDLLVELPRMHPAQLRIVTDPARFVVVLAGRGFGKSTVAGCLCLAALLTIPHARLWYVGPTYPDTNIQWQDIQRMGLPESMVSYHQGERRVDVPRTDGMLTIRSAHVGEAGLRGGQRDLVVMDECGSIKDGGDIWQKAIRPSLGVRKGRAIFIGTPRGRNWFSDLYTYAAAGMDPEWSAHHYTSAANPYLDPDEILAAQRSLPERVYRQEYLAEIIADGGAVIREVAAAVRPELPRQPYTGDVVIGVDWGKHEDFTVFCVIDRITGALVHIDRFNQIDYTVQAQRLQELCARWKPRSVLVERNSIGEPILEQLQREGLPVTGFATTAQSKPPLIEDLALAFERHEITIPDNPLLIAELEALAVKVSSTGRPDYRAPTGMHDDTVMALALAWHERIHCGLTSYEVITL